MSPVEFEPAIPVSERLLTRRRPHGHRGWTSLVHITWVSYLCSSFYNNLTYLKQVYEHVLELTNFYENARRSIGEFHVDEFIVKVFFPLSRPSPIPTKDTVEQVTAYFPGLKWRGAVKLATHTYRVTGLRMCGVVPLLHLYTVLA